MAQLVAHVDEEGFLRLDLLDHFHRLRDGEMGRVGGMAEGVDHEDIDAPRGLDGLRGHRLAVRHVSEQPPVPTLEDQPVRDRPAMRKLHRDDGRLSQIKRPSDHDRLRAHVVPDFPAVLEGILENSCEIFQRPLRAIDGHAFVLDFTKPPEVVKPEDMVAVRVGIDHGVELYDPLAQALGAEIRRRIHAENGLRRPEENRGPQTFVAWVRRLADPATAADHGDPMRCARP